MDPLSITTAVLSITAQCIGTAKQLSKLRTQYSLASTILTAITSETTVVSASLAQIQNALLLSAGGGAAGSNDYGSRIPAGSGLLMHLEHDSVLAQTLDSALIGCSVVFSALQEEVDKLELGCFRAAGQNGSLQLDWKTRLKLVWKEDDMKELLNQIRGQQTSLAFLLQTLSMDSMSEVVRLVKNNSTVLEKMASSTEKLRQSYPSIRSPASIFECAGEDGVSMYSGGASTAGATEFDFDAFITDSKVYRRAFMGGFLRPRRIRDDESETDTIRGQDDSEVSTAVNTPSTQSMEGSTIHANDLVVEVLNVNAPDGTRIRMNAREVAMLLKDKRGAGDITLTVQAPAGGEIVLNSKDVANMLSKHDELNEKYRKVKKYYFDKEATVCIYENALALAQGESLPHPNMGSNVRDHGCYECLGRQVGSSST